MMFSTMASVNSGFMRLPSLISGECCEEITTVSTPTGTPSR